MTKKRIFCEYEGCSKGYCSSFNLKRHVESSHFGVRKFQCPVCYKYLSSKQNMIDHQNIHTGAKPYVCEVQGCRQLFRQLSQFYLHKQLHSEVSNHLCRSSNFIDKSLNFLVGILSNEYSKSSYIRKDIQYDQFELPKIKNEKVFGKLPFFAGLIKD